MKKKFIVKCLLSMILISPLVVDQVQAEVLDKEPNVKRQWKLKYQEKLNKELPTDGADWVLDSYGNDSPWHVDHLDDDGDFLKSKEEMIFLSSLTVLIYYENKCSLEKMAG